MQKTLWTKYRLYQYPLIFGLISGVFTGGSFIPFPAWAILFNFSPLWWFWTFKAENRKQILLSGIIAQFTFNLIGFHWVFHTAHEFGHIPWPLSFLVLLLFALLAHLYVPLVGLLYYEFKRSIVTPSRSDEGTIPPLSLIGLLLGLVGLWCLAEIYWPYIFQWNMGYTLLWAKFPLYHWADVIGFQGLSLLLLLFNAFFVYWFRNQQTIAKGLFRTSTLQGVLLALTTFALLNLTGWLHGRSWNLKQENTQTLHFLPIQANIGNTEKIMAERGIGYQDFIVDKFILLSEQAIARHPEAQVLVWPESAIPDYLDPEFSNRHRPQKIKNMLIKTQKSLIAGGYSKEIKTDPQTKKILIDNTYNALFSFNADSTLSAPPYRKHQLLAFGEYTPFARWFPYLNEISPSGKGFDSGPGPGVIVAHIKATTPTTDPSQFTGNNGGTITTTSSALPTPFVFAPQICYESLSPEHTRQSVLQGAQVLINITNDSWFGFYSEPYQHLSMTFARAIENRRPLLRVTNTGITSGIESSGQELIPSPLYQEWAEILTLHYSEKPSLTLFTRYGGFIPIIVLLLILGGFAIALYQRPSSKKFASRSIK